jgi:ketosteroid isomerase-like protein
MNNGEAEVRQLVEDWAAAVRRKDLAGIVRNHSPNILAPRGYT